MRFGMAKRKRHSEPTPEKPPQPNWFVRAYLVLPGGDRVAIEKALIADSAEDAIEKVRAPLRSSGIATIERVVTYFPPNPWDPPHSMERLYRY